MEKPGGQHTEDSLEEDLGKNSCFDHIQSAGLKF